ncbi:DUF1631 family protein [Hydrogenophaga sp. PBL-H3]|uniref:DUF1631 family protein n=1 Tax=Hydrogenophaga sp. PBL-H3 TaxID=434010 RepID=UPI00131FC4C8|nr:DUF1631 family protein [Hydrogenophaga sp. PBL-H3]QHE75840.1 DUF1631 domain-containing protein [Hydrogenophaga sp. PBL-H3]QHE80265.1 DUF1631 domain-containing protein [Hydrogenophaga sp. PBL-H3]
MDADLQAFDACLKEALVQTREWVPRWLDRLNAGLKDKELSARHLNDKQAFVEARTALESRRDLIATHFLAALADAVGNAMPGNDFQAQSGKAVSFDELELMGDDQVQETVELARVQQIVNMTVDHEIVELTARLCTTLGMQVVTVEANPLRADVIVSALMKTLKGLNVGPAIRSRWLQTGAISLGNELQGLYTRLSNQLDRMGVEPAGYAVVQMPEGRPNSGFAPLGERSSPTQDEAAPGNDALLTLDHLHQLLVGNLGQPDDEPRREAGTTGAGNAMVRTLASEVVSLMLKQISADERLLPPVREMLQGMKPALLQVARTDPRFFADRQNPARRLLDAITEHSLAYTNEQDRGYAAFSRQVRGIIDTLQKPGSDLADRFPGLLQHFNRSQTEAMAPEQVQARGLAVKTLVRVEQRNLLAERVAAEFRSRNDFDRSPGVVRRFLTGPWAQVVAQARLEVSNATGLGTSEVPSMRYSDILPDLLWSTQLAVASLNRPRLVKVIPSLLRTLREGLDSIDYPREQTEAFFQTLMGLHEAAYKTQRAEPLQDVQPSQQFEDDTEPWMQPAEARDTCFMDDSLSDTQPSFVDTQPMQREWVELKAEMVAQPPSQLSAGTWVDLWQDGQAVRCQITWASPHGTLFLFSGANGRSLSMTRRGLDRLIEQDKLRVVADHGVVNQALDEVARQAWLNSAKTDGI